MIKPVQLSSPRYRVSLRERWRVWFTNILSVHHRWMMRYLQRRGWVVFYLDEQSRQCNAVCWMESYQQSLEPEIKAAITRRMTELYL